MVKVTDTAAMIARIRAAERELPEAERLFDDPYAHLFVGDPDTDGTGIFSGFPFMRDQVRLRTRFLDDFVRHGIGRGARQLVILGAGFDCRALRLPEVRRSETSAYEVDFAEQLARKREILAAAGKPIRGFPRLVACDLSAEGFEPGLSADLQREGFRLGEAALFVWEGVVNYLEPQAVDRTLRWMAAVGGPGSAAAFNYSANTLGGFGMDPKQVPERVAAAGFVSLDDQSFADLYRSYLRGEPPDVAELFRIAIAGR